MSYRFLKFSSMKKLLKLKFVPGQVIETKDEGLKFVPGQVIETKSGSKFVPGQSVQTEDGSVRFVPGQILHTKAGATFIPGNFDRIIILEYHGDVSH